MKFLVIQENGRHDLNRNFRECFSIQRSLNALGHYCDIFGKGHDLVVQDFNHYDVIINLENYDQEGWLPDISKSKAKKFLWAIDAHVRGVEVYENEFIKNKYDYILHSTFDFCQEKHHIWFPNAYDDTLITNLQLDKIYDVGFCGNVANRGNIIELLKSTIKNFKFDEFVIGEDMVKAINTYKIHFNKNISNDINYRSFETIGAGTLLLTNFNHQYERLGFIDFKSCVFYNSSNDLINKIDILLSNPSLIQTISNNGYELAKRHTYLERIKMLIYFIENESK